MTIDRDGTVIINISADEMAAVAHITPPDGLGNKITLDGLKNALSSAGVTSGILPDSELKGFVDKGGRVKTDFVAASGIPPVDGRAPTLIISSNNSDWTEQSIPELLEGILLPCDLLVDPGDVIGSFSDSIVPCNGYTVTGREIPAKSFGSSNINIKTGANVATDDGTEFRSMIDGLPRLSEGTLYVDPVFIIEGDLGKRNRNIIFSGAIYVKGDVPDNFVIKAQGSIVVEGDVGSCDILSRSGDIIIKGNVKGTGKGVIKSENGSVRAKSLDAVNVHASSNVIALSYITNSFVRCDGHVVCSSRGGWISGGDVLGGSSVRSACIGCAEGDSTTIRTGYSLDSFIDISDLEGLVKSKQKEIETLVSQAVPSGGNGSDRTAEMKRNVNKLKAEKVSIENRLGVLMSRPIDILTANIKATTAIFPGVSTHLGGAEFRFDKKYSDALLSYAGGDGIELTCTNPETGQRKSFLAGNSTGKKTILIVDDARFMRNKLRKILEDNNFRIIGEANDGMEAIERFNALRPDVTTMDITMPNLDGITSLKAIKKIKPDAKVVMISALGQKDKVRAAINAGAMDFVVKPFSPQRVIEVITRIAGK